MAFSGDIQRATISFWLKQTVLLVYQSSDFETQIVPKVQAHEVHSMADYLALTGGPSLD